MDRVHKSPAVVNFDKLLWHNEQHLRRMASGNDISILLDETRNFVYSKFGTNYSDEYITKVLQCMKVRYIFKS